MKISSEGNPHSDGALLALQMYVAKLIAMNPQHGEILASMTDFADGLQQEAVKAAGSGDNDQYFLVSDVAAGARDCVNSMMENVQILLSKR